MKRFLLLMGVGAALIYACTEDRVAQFSVDDSESLSPTAKKSGHDEDCQPLPPEPRPLGTVQVDDDGIGIGRCFGSGDRCIEFTVTCPGIGDAEGTLRVTGSGAAGTVGLNTGGPGTGLFGNQAEDVVREFMDDLLEDGHLLVEVGWTFPGVWEGPGTTTSLACRAATITKWVHDNSHLGGPFIFQGNSGGSAQIAFSLAYYGLDVLDLANLSGGPPPCPIATDGLVNFAEQPLCVVGGDLFDETREPMLFGDPRFHYPNTTVRFFIGEDEPSSYIVETANEYHDKITSDKSLQTIPNTGHQVQRTEEGAAAMLASIREIAEEADDDDDECDDDLDDGDDGDEVDEVDDDGDDEEGDDDDEEGEDDDEGDEVDDDGDEVDDDEGDDDDGDDEDDDGDDD